MPIQLVQGLRDTKHITDWLAGIAKEEQSSDPGLGSFDKRYLDWFGVFEHQKRNAF